MDTLVSQTYLKLRTLWITQYYTPIRIRLLLAKAYLIQGHLYGCELFCNCDSNSKRKLNVLFNNIVRYIFGLKRRDRISSFSKTLYGVSFENFLNIRFLMFLHKIIYTSKPNYMFNMLQFARSRRGKKLIIPTRRYLVSE